ncbi:MAG: hypothetical protein ACI88H_000733 [Cocleimonas sp.]|jgi:hypothetical protein
MYNKNKIEITLLVNNKSGVLSSLMVKGGSLGLIYRRQQSEKIDDNNSRIVLSFDGKLNCNKHESIRTFEEHPEVTKVEKIVVTGTQ